MKLIATTMALVALSAAASAQTVFSQDFSDDNGVISEGVSGGFFDQRLADNFSLSSAGGIVEASWWGAEEEFFSPGFPGNIDGFRVEFFESTAGLPGASLYSEDINIADITATDTGAVFPFGQPIYRFDAALAAPVNLTAGTEYWFSVGVLPINDLNDDDSFFWASSFDGENISAEEAPALSGNWVTRDQDFAFELRVPEPSSLALLAVGLMLGVRRR